MLANTETSGQCKDLVILLPLPAEYVLFTTTSRTSHGAHPAS